MVKGILPITELTNLVAIMDLNEDDKNLIISQLNRYANVCSDALEVVSSHCTDICDSAEENNRQDEEDETLTECENDSWIGLSKMMGYTEDPRPEWYIDMWG